MSVFTSTSYFCHLSAQPSSSVLPIMHLCDACLHGCTFLKNWPYFPHKSCFKPLSFLPWIDKTLASSPEIKSILWICLLSFFTNYLDNYMYFTSSAVRWDHPELEPCPHVFPFNIALLCLTKILLEAFTEKVLFQPLPVFQWNIFCIQPPLDGTVLGFKVEGITVVFLVFLPIVLPCLMPNLHKCYKQPLISWVSISNNTNSMILAYVLNRKGNYNKKKQELHCLMICGAILTFHDQVRTRKYTVLYFPFLNMKESHQMPSQEYAYLRKKPWWRPAYSCLANAHFSLSRET